jgi:sugar/nucleoside kinase (ribokinase family)
MESLRTDIHNWRYRALIGVGGIGSGVFFALNSNLTLGREDSRSGHFLNQKDYCKLHIISHYVKKLLGPEFIVLPIGKMGDDEVGRRLISEMTEAGLDTRYVEACPGEQTLFSFCYLYPDGTGGNLTTDNSACDRVDASTIATAQADFQRYSRMGIALAAPEVPLAARRAILDLGSAYHFFRAASFAAEEIGPAIETGLIQKCDLLAINLEEAGAAASLPVDLDYPEKIVKTAMDRIREYNPSLAISITAGKRGSWLWDGTTLDYHPIFQTQAVSTAGAGDAHFSGILAGIAAGLTYPEAHELGALVAAFSVTSPHTIAHHINRDALRSFARVQEAPLSKSVQDLLDDESE